LQIMSLVTIRDVKLLEMHRHESLVMQEVDLCGFSTQGLKINSLKCTKYSYEHMVALGVAVSCAPWQWERNIASTTNIVYFQCLCREFMPIIIVQFDNFYCKTSVQPQKWPSKNAFDYQTIQRQIDCGPGIIPKLRAGCQSTKMSFIHISDTFRITIGIIKNH